MPKPRSDFAARLAAATHQLEASRAAGLPDRYRVACEVLLAATCARVVWRSFPTDQLGVIAVMRAVGDALADATREVGRPSRTQEREDIERVIALAKNLRHAVIGSSLPRDTEYFGVIARHRDGREDRIAFSWHSTSEPVGQFGTVIVLTEYLELAIRLAKRYLDGLPLRATARLQNPPALQQDASGEDAAYAFRRAMVPFLHWHLHRLCGIAPNGAIAAILNVLVELPADKHIDAKGVARILARTSPVFLRPRKEEP